MHPITDGSLCQGVQGRQCARKAQPTDPARHGPLPQTAVSALSWVSPQRRHTDHHVQALTAMSPQQSPPSASSISSVLARSQQYQQSDEQNLRAHRAHTESTACPDPQAAVSQAETPAFIAFRRDPNSSAVCRQTLRIRRPHDSSASSLLGRASAARCRRRVLQHSLKSPISSHSPQWHVRFPDSSLLGRSSVVAVQIVHQRHCTQHAEKVRLTSAFAGLFKSACKEVVMMISCVRDEMQTPCASAV